MIAGMSRSSPSGPTEVTDVKHVAFGLNAVAAGSYLSLVNSGFASSFPLPTGIAIETGAIEGLMPHKGALGAARLATGTDGGAVAGDAILQWRVNGVAKGNAVPIPFTPALPVSATVLDLLEAVIDFGDVEWQAGEYLQLVLTTTGVTGPGTVRAMLAYEIQIEAGRPRTIGQ